MTRRHFLVSFDNCAILVAFHEPEDALMATEWYCRVQGTESGPLSATDLRRLATDGRINSADLVRRGLAGDWTPAAMVKGLFDAALAAPHVVAAPTVTPQVASSHIASPESKRDSAARTNGEAYIDRLPEGAGKIRSVYQCISREERKHRLGVLLVNVLVWALLLFIAFATLGAVLLVYLFGKVVSSVFAEYNVRRLQALGTAVSDKQFPQVSRALRQVCEQFQLKQIPRVIIINESSTNAFAVKFARHKVIVLFSQTLEGILNEPAELRFLLAHEVAHTVLDHGFRGSFEAIKPAAYKAGRELTCDNCGVAAAGDVQSATTLLKRLAVGNHLHPQVRDDVLIEESEYIYSGFSGWLLKRNLNYPPIGKRIANVVAFGKQL